MPAPIYWGRSHVSGAERWARVQNTSGARLDQGYYWWPIGSRIRVFNWCQNQRPWMTLNGHYALCFKMHAFSEPNRKIWMKINLHYQRRRCSPMTSFCNIRFIQIFAAVPWTGGVKWVGSSKMAMFSTFALYFFKSFRGMEWITLLYLVRLSTDPKIRDLPWVAILH